MLLKGAVQMMVTQNMWPNWKIQCTCQVCKSSAQTSSCTFSFSCLPSCQAVWPPNTNRMEPCSATWHPPRGAGAGPAAAALLHIHACSSVLYSQTSLKYLQKLGSEHNLCIQAIRFSRTSAVQMYRCSCRGSKPSRSNDGYRVAAWTQYLLGVSCAIIMKASKEYELILVCNHSMA